MLRPLRLRVWPPLRLEVEGGEAGCAAGDGGVCHPEQGSAHGADISGGGWRLKIVDNGPESILSAYINPPFRLSTCSPSTFSGPFLPQTTPRWAETIYKSSIRVMVFTQGAEFDPEEDEPTLEAAWPHLQLVYEFFLRCCCHKCMRKCCHCHCPAGVLSPQISSPILPKNTSTRDLSWRYGNCYFSSCWFLRQVITAGRN